MHRNRVHSASGNGIDLTPKGEGGKLPLAAPVNARVTRNKVEHVKLAGLHMAAGTEDVTVTGNTALDNDTWDCQDKSGSAGGGLADIKNTWRDNLGRTDAPNGLCAEPVAPTDTPDHGKGHHKQHRKHHQPDPCTCQERHPKAY